jgi:uncharacterized protein YndB with AHSA1/START domain
MFKLEMQSDIQITAARQRVWTVFAANDRWTSWCDVCLRADTSDEFDWRVGDRLYLRFRMAGLGVPFNVDITESVPGERVEWASRKFSVTAVRTFTFAETDDGTLVTDHKLFTARMLPLRLFYPRPVIRHMTESMLTSLKRECERTS